jgi:NAD+ diphosphatase
MLGFRARAVSTDIRRDDEELEDCRWFSRAEVRAFGELRSEPAGYRLPNPFSISRFLIDSWLYET